MDSHKRDVEPGRAAVSVPEAERGDMTVMAGHCRRVAAPDTQGHGSRSAPVYDLDVRVPGCGAGAAGRLAFVLREARGAWRNRRRRRPRTRPPAVPAGRPTVTDGRALGRPRAPARHRLWLVLVLVTGLLGMHGLASDHAGMGTVAAAPSGVVHVVDHGMSEMDMTAPAADPVSNDPVSTWVHGPGEHDRTDMAGLCIAVLAGVLLLAVVRRWRPAGERSGRRDLSRLIARPRALPLCRPPDLVAGLCVSRT